MVLDEVTDPRRLAVRIRAALADAPGPLDIIVTRTDDLVWRSGFPGTIEYAAVHEGRTVYDQAA